MRPFCKPFIIFCAAIFTVAITFANDNKSNAPVLMQADLVHYDANSDVMIAQGNVVITMDGHTLYADTVHYDIKQDIVFAEENVKVVNQSGDVMFGHTAVLKDKFKYAIIQEFAAHLENNATVVARIAKRLGKEHFLLEKAVFSPCVTNCGKNPIWQIRSKSTKINYENETVVHKHSFFEIYGVPVFYTPYFMHPTPNAQARSGILVPEIENNSFVIPLYWRIKQNIDFTLRPRIAKDYHIFDGEFRHKIESGEYSINGSYGDSLNYSKKQHKKFIVQDTKSKGSYLFAKGKFAVDKINFGFNYKHASDKAYLANYNKMYNSYLASKIYANTINKRNYFSLESLYYQDLRVRKKKQPLPFILPYIRVQQVFPINNDESILFNVRNNTTVYTDLTNLQLARTALDLELMANIFSKNGHMFTYTLSNRSDLYWVNYGDQMSQAGQQKILSRNIPEFSVLWRYPLGKSISDKSTIKIEPTTKLTIGQKFEKKLDKFTFIDTNKVELSENNIFHSNKFGGVDFHEYGSRFSYGINSTLMSTYLYIDTFLGQELNKNNVSTKGNSEYIGSASITLMDNLELFYSFRKDKKFTPIKNEIASSISLGDLKVTTAWTKLSNIGQYFAQDRSYIKQNKVSQLNWEIDYQLMQNLALGYETKIDITNKPRTLIQTIRMTYLFDCVRISGEIMDTYMHDSVRGVKKLRSQSFAIRLKAINM
ncbi:MAG: LPS-assembly protein LptD [Rickettsiaceae bacterium]